MVGIQVTENDKIFWDREGVDFLEIVVVFEQKYLIIDKYSFFWLIFNFDEDVLDIWCLRDVFTCKFLWIFYVLLGKHRLH